MTILTIMMKFYLIIWCAWVWCMCWSLHIPGRKYVAATRTKIPLRQPFPPQKSLSRRLTPSQRSPMSCHMSKHDNSHHPYTSVMIVPTGIGCSIGGYAGDALPSALLLATVADRLITHPNVMNGAMLYHSQLGNSQSATYTFTAGSGKNILYVEGNMLNHFMKGKIALQPLLKGSQRIGVLLDKNIEEELQLRHIQVCDAMKATLGIHIEHIVVTSEALGISTQVSTSSNASWGSIDNITTLLEGANVLKALGCTAIAVIARFPEDYDEEAFALYQQGQGVDMIAGVEALISHVITKHVGLPCAHAPAFSTTPIEEFMQESVAPKAAAEELGFTFLPCVLANLHRAPHFIPIAEDIVTSSLDSSLITHDDVDSIVVPFDALGGPGVLSLLQKHRQHKAQLEATTPTHLKAAVSSALSAKVKKVISSEAPLIIAVQENQSTMQVSATDLPQHYQEHVLIVRSYAEAAGYLAAHKAGIDFEALTSQVSSVPISRL